MEREHFQLIQYAGRQIIFLDFVGLAGEDYARVIEQTGLQEEAVGGTDRLMLADVTDSVVDKQALAAFKRVTKKNGPNISKAAIVGISGIQELFLSIVNTVSGIGAKPFKTREEAMEWLVS